jgi:hypothetical protein
MWSAWGPDARKASAASEPNEAGTLSTSKAPSPRNPSSTSPIREASAGELAEYLRSLPPLQRETVVAAEYVGRTVLWRGRLAEVVSTESGFIVAVHDFEDVEALTMLLFADESRGALSTLRVGDDVEFSGSISEFGRKGGVVDGHSIRRLPASQQ